jgi:general nucleoside transport system permease protein
MTATVVDDATLRARKRERYFAVFSFLVAALCFFVFANERAGTSATFVLNDARGGLFLLPNLVVAVVPTVITLGVLALAIGVLQVTRGFGRFAVPMVGLVGLLLVAGLLVWASAGQTVSLVSLFRGTLFAAIPITMGALAGVVCERAGVINIAIEGQLLSGAFLAAVMATVFGGPWWGLAGGIIAGLLIAGMLSVLSIHFQADQIVTGVVLIVFATGITSFLGTQVLARNPNELNSPARFGSFAIPLLSDIPFVGPIFFNQTVFGYTVLASVIGLQIALFRTRWGLRLRSVGEHPKAADTVGISVLGTRYKAVLLGGVFAGIGGAWFTLDSTSSFSREMTSGRGFIALAAMLVGRYSPVGAFGAALLFGFSDALATILQRLPVPIPSQLLRIAPFLVTILVVAGLIGRLRVPAADGQPYVKE